MTDAHQAVVKSMVECLSYFSLKYLGRGDSVYGHVCKFVYQQDYTKPTERLLKLGWDLD